MNLYTTKFGQFLVTHGAVERIVIIVDSFMNLYTTKFGQMLVAHGAVE